MIEVHWINHFQHVEHIFGTFTSMEEAEQSIYKWWKEHKFHPYRLRKWTREDGTIVWGYGTQNCFYHFKEVN